MFSWCQGLSGHPVFLFLFLCCGTALSPYDSTHSANSTSTTKQLSGWNYRGCYSDHQDGRFFNTQAEYWNDTTTAKCAEYTSSHGDLFFGLEYGFQCWYGNAVHSNASSLLSDQENCDSPCHGDALEICGGTWYISVYGADVAPSTTQSTNTTNGADDASSTQPANTTNGSNKRLTASDKIELGVGISFGVVMFILAALTLGLKCYKRRRPDVRRDDSARGQPTAQVQRGSVDGAH